MTLSYLSDKTVVGPSPIHGRGLFARVPIARGEVVCIKGGHASSARSRPPSARAA